MFFSPTHWAPGVHYSCLQALPSLPPSPSAVVAILQYTELVGWIVSESHFLLFFCVCVCEGLQLSIAGSKSPKVSPFGSCMFLLWPLFQIQIAFQLPFVQHRGLWTGKRDREVSEVPKGQSIPIMSPSVREEGRERESERERHI